jgi:hypothetical protein
VLARTGFKVLQLLAQVNRILASQLRKFGVGTFTTFAVANGTLSAYE